MALDDLIDQLAFGKTTPKIKTCLGMYLSPETIYISEVHLEKGQLAVDHLVRIPVPAAGAGKPGTPAATGTLNTDFLMDNAKLVQLVRQSMSQIRWNSKEVMVTLSHHLGLLRYFTMPQIERRFLANAVPLEAKKYIPIPFETLMHDFQVLPLPPDAANKPRQGALVCVTQNKNLANVLALLEGLGLNLIGMEVAPCSVLRVWETLEKPAQGKTHCQVHFDAGNIRILLADRGVPIFFRELFLGKEPAATDLRKIDLVGCLGFAQKQLGVGGLAQLRVSGAAQNIDGWRQAFAQEAGVEAVVQDTAARLGIKGGDWGGYASIGAAAKFLVPSPITLDLGKVGKISEEERRTAKNIFIASALVAGGLALAGLYRNAIYGLKVQELGKIQVEEEIATAFQDLGESQIEDLLKEMRQQRDAVRMVGGPRLKASELLRDIVDALPDKSWITQLSYRNPLERRESDPIEVQIIGNATAQNTTQEQELALQFRERLTKTPVLGAHFLDIQVSVTAKNAAETSAGLEPAALARQMEGRTTFSIVAKSKKP